MIKGFLGVTRELVTMLREERAWWLIPMVLCLTVLGGVVYLGTSSAAAPFLYTLF